MNTPIDIAAIRGKLGLTLAQVGARLGGLHRTTVGRWESGKTMPRGPALKALRELEAEAAARDAEGARQSTDRSTETGEAA